MVKIPLLKWSILIELVDEIVIDLTPLIPLSLRRRGGRDFREAKPLFDSP